MKIEASFIVHAPRDRVWTAITDPARVAPCVPGCEPIEIVGRLGRFGFGIMRKKGAALGDDFAEPFRARVEQDEAA